jgi:transcription antitermination factor NusG
MEQQTLEQRVEWYVLRVTYQREMIAKRRLDELSIESFVPTKVVRVTLQNGRRALQRRALVHNYIFIRSDRATIDQIKSFELPYLRYVMHTVNGVRQAMVVPEQQMRSFMLVTGTEDERLMLLDSTTTPLSSGTRVRVTGGVFAGAEGLLVKVAGARERRVVVRIEGIAAVATPRIERELLEKIE